MDRPAEIPPNSYGERLLWGALILSLLFHLLVVLGALDYSKLFDRTPPPPKAVETRFVTPSELSQLQRQVHAPTLLAPPAKPDPRKSVVETEQAAKSLPITGTARYLGEKSQRVERETVAAQFGSVLGGTGKEKTLPKKSELLKPQEKSREQAEHHKDMLKRLGVGPDVFLPPEEKSKPEPEQKTSESPDGFEGDPKLHRGSMDNVRKDVAIGPQTLLNTDEFAFASFFNRLKRELGPRWEPLVSEAISDPRRRLHAGVYPTQAEFYLDSEGRVIRARILQRSGEPVFDDIALSSIYHLPPMRNIPEKLREEDGSYRIEIGFMVNLGSGGIRFDYVPDSRL
ncbi:MAG: hypothetical protein JST16_13715 [Bdellovibrionales bacterium]|nr:hypothetical protein [Bdellovibrionales bacterium]